MLRRIRLELLGARPGLKSLSRARCQRAGAVPASNGFTLIELMVALLLFALISLAGVSLVETVIGVQHRTSARALRLAQIQRAMVLIDADFESLSAGPRLDDGSVSLVRDGSQGPHAIAYRLEGTALHRVLDGQDRVIIDGLATFGMRFYKSGQGWSDVPMTPDDASRPLGIELTAVLSPQPGAMAGPLRRVIALPAEAPR